MITDQWQAIKDHQPGKLCDLFESDQNRAEKYSFEEAGIFFDFAKTHFDDDLIKKFSALSKTLGLGHKITALFDGEKVNTSEARSAEHGAERGSGNMQSVDNAEMLRRRMYGLAEAISNEAFGPIKHIIHLGIGGSALGPELLLSALSLGDEKYETAVVSNIDGAALEPVLERFDAHATLLVVASKTFTTTETLLNAQTTLDWMKEEGVDDPYGRVIGLTAAPDKAVEWGLDESRILPFSDNVGGRYSLWCSISFAVVLALGPEAFDDMLRGAKAMDDHFRTNELSANIPVIAAFADQYYNQVRGCETRAVFAYDERLRLLPDYLQQLEMESNGKSVTSDGDRLELQSSPIVWGGVGTDAQHAVFQLLHQGTRLVPVEFVAVVEAGDSLSPDHHRALLMNCFAQGAALMEGKNSDNANRNYPGDRPSVTILLDELSPKSLGALLAFYEHRTFVNSILLNINPFDQFGVELGKLMANQLLSGGGDKMDSSTEQLKKRAFAA